MKTPATINEFSDFRIRTLSEKEHAPSVPTLVVCAGTGGQASGSNDIMRIIKLHTFVKIYATLDAAEKYIKER